MKTNRKNLIQQREIIEKKLRNWLGVRVERRPPSGWINAIRGSLGLSTRQLASRMGSDQANIVRLQEREVSGRATIELLDRAARAMNCKFIYAVVPEDRYETLEAILDEQSIVTAKRLVAGVAHSMKLESQDLQNSDNETQIVRLARELKEKLSAELWVDTKNPKKPKKAKSSKT